MFVIHGTEYYEHAVFPLKVKRCYVPALLTIVRGTMCLKVQATIVGVTEDVLGDNIFGAQLELSLASDLAFMLPNSLPTLNPEVVSSVIDGVKTSYMCIEGKSGAVLCLAEPETNTLWFKYNCSHRT